MFGNNTIVLLSLCFVLGLVTGPIITNYIHSYVRQSKILSLENKKISIYNTSELFIEDQKTEKRDTILISLITGLVFTLLVFKTVLNNQIFFDPVLIEAGFKLPISSIFMIFGFYAFTISAVLLAVIDAKTNKLPTSIIYASFVIIGLLFIITMLVSFLTGFVDIFYVQSVFTDMGIGAVALFLVYFVIWFFNPKSMGFGDVRLALLLGLVLGTFSIGHVIVGFALPYLILLVVIIVLLIMRKIDNKTKMPLGPWMIVGSILSILFAEYIIPLFLQTGGLQYG